MTIQSVYGGRDRVPGQSAAVETFENEFLFGTYPYQQISGLTIDGAARDAGNTGKTHILRAGLLLGQVTATKKLKEWSPTATDGTEYIWGILKESRTMLSQNTDTDRLTGLIVIAGGVLSKRLIIPGNVAMGIAGDTLEFQVRQQLRANFILNDTYQVSRPEMTIHTVSAAEQTAGITLTHDDSHRAYHNAGGTVTIALPTTALRGVKYQFYAQTSTTDAITVSSASANILVPGSAAANSLAVDGAIKEVEGDGTNWIVKAL
jgi:hypothetical protein